MNFRLREIREHNDLTQREMAKLLKISKSYYNYFETGERIITVPHLNNFCNIFHYSMDYVLGLSEQSIISKKHFTLDQHLVGQRIRTIRKMHHLKQHELADIMHTSQSTISAYENGKSLILTAFLYEMCKALNVSADYIIGRSNTIKVYIKLEK